VCMRLGVSRLFVQALTNTTLLQLNHRVKGPQNFKVRQLISFVQHKRKRDVYSLPRHLHRHILFINRQHRGVQILHPEDTLCSCMSTSEMLRSLPVQLNSNGATPLSMKRHCVGRASARSSLRAVSSFQGCAMLSTCTSFSASSSLKWLWRRVRPKRLRTLWATNMSRIVVQMKYSRF